MTDSDIVRSTFLEAARFARAVLADKRVAQQWEGTSVLRDFSLKGLSGHLVRAVTSVETYLDGPPPEDAPLGADAYYAMAVDETDISSPLHVAIRQRGEEQAGEGHSRLLQNLDGAIHRLDERLSIEPTDRAVRVFRDLPTTLDAYLQTRIVELLVHADDLACSIGEANIELPERPLASAIGTLVAVGRHRHGDRAILRALSRRERDEVQALRIF